MIDRVPTSSQKHTDLIVTDMILTNSTKLKVKRGRTVFCVWAVMMDREVKHITASA